MYHQSCDTEPVNLEDPHAIREAWARQRQRQFVAIAWTLNNPAVLSAIVGIRTVAQLAGMDRAAELVLRAEVIGRLDEIFNINHGRPLRPGPAPEAYSW